MYWFQVVRPVRFYSSSLDWSQSVSLVTLDLGKKLLRKGIKKEVE